MSGLPLTLELLAVPEAVPEMRRMLRGRFAGEDAGDLVLCVSELLRNVIVHVGEGTPVTLRVTGTHTGRLRIALSDPAPVVWPVLRSAGADGTSGRGPLLVDAVALRWGVEQGPYRKTVWCELRAPGPGRQAAGAGRFGGSPRRFVGLQDRGGDASATETARRKNRQAVTEFEGIQLFALYVVWATLEVGQK
ncbi:ATP-binding protein [Streptomyces sp. A0958]|uniref:ATP-binding protein n=1 Tax=Streptomyces sp. A0958 TaxID=2563101 RepID=UPI001F117524|nr:ATP-binding protein [Streptomyces sp. A0958]